MILRACGDRHRRRQRRVRARNRCGRRRHARVRRDVVDRFLCFRAAGAGAARLLLQRVLEQAALLRLWLHSERRVRRGHRPVDALTYIYICLYVHYYHLHVYIQIYIGHRPVDALTYNIRLYVYHYNMYVYLYILATDPSMRSPASVELSVIFP